MMTKNKKRKLKNWITNILLFFLLSIGLILVFNNQIRGWVIRKNSQAYTINHITPREAKKNNQKKEPFNFKSVESLSNQSVLKAQFENKKLPMIGSIAIPSVEVNLPIFKGLSNAALLKGAGTMKADEKMGEGNYSLASHRTQDERVLFTPIERTSIGDNIYITDLEKVYTYKIDFIKKVSPTQVELIDDVPNQKLITLITCGDINAASRIAVQGKLSAVTPIKQASKDILDAFQLEQRTLKSWVE
ncbi:sortase A, LPXTG specific [Melissococcus plutonius ATCC 35311]|uniref:Sortase A, LPXTG specific n=2 Tax=Melissococcus plutonius TaxID=33970 RepID=F3Y7S4_MELPT|nr:class A sortase [Melissococcus plutonius]BAK20552.1 sortase A, LPXTG specific [Melissococcus plutonius ATCC 35311]